jgi:peptidoglycan/LPS O-acetylase OafA/YrhL
LTFLNFIHPMLPGLFENNTLSVVNGALWTLKIEVMFYVSVPFIAFLFRKWGHFKVMVVLYCLSVGYASVLTSLSVSANSDLFLVLARQLPGQLSYFLSGIYIIHFPVIQVFISAGWFIHSPYYFLLAVVSTTLFCAVALWHVVEKIFLLRNNHYVEITGKSMSTASSVTPN